MNLSALLFLFVLFLAAFVLLAHVAVNPWWGILALALACLLAPFLARRAL